MDKVEKERLIREKSEQIAQLKKEIQMLKGTPIGMALAEEETYHFIPGKKIRLASNPSRLEVWDSIVDICVFLHSVKYDTRTIKQLKQNDLSIEDRALSTEMAREFIHIWNKYMELAYNFTPDEMVPEYGDRGGAPVYRYE